MRREHATEVTRVNIFTHNGAPQALVGCLAALAPRKIKLNVPRAWSISGRIEPAGEAPDECPVFNALRSCTASSSHSGNPPSRRKHAIGFLTLRRRILLFALRDDPERVVRHGRCSVSASTVSPSSQRSNSSIVVRITGIALGWTGATMALASVVKNPNSSCSTSTGALFGPRTPRQRVHNPANANSGRSSLSAEPCRRLARRRRRIFAERRCRDDGAVLRSQPAAPVRTRDVADVGDRLAAKLRRSGHSPTRQDKLAFAIYSVADNRRELVREDAREERQVASPVVGGAEQGADGGLAFGFGIQVAHVGHP